jgi:hypothetical protein
MMSDSVTGDRAWSRPAVLELSLTASWLAGCVAVLLWPEPPDRAFPIAATGGTIPGLPWLARLAFARPQSRGDLLAWAAFPLSAVVAVGCLLFRAAVVRPLPPTGGP